MHFDVLGQQTRHDSPMRKPSQSRCKKKRRSRLPTAKTRAYEWEIALKEHPHFFDISQDAIFLWRQPGGIEFWNKGAAELYGYTEQEAHGQISHDLLKTTPPVPWPEIERQLHERGSWQGELRHIARDGRNLAVVSRLQLLPSEKGTLLILESNRDVTEMQRRMREQAITAQFSIDALEASAFRPCVMMRPIFCESTPARTSARSSNALPMANQCCFVLESAGGPGMSE